MIITIPGHFACSSFAMHQHLTAAPPVRTALRDFGPRQVVLVCLRLRAPPDGGIVRRLAQSCRFLLSVMSAFSRRPRNYYVDARLISNERGQFCNMLARMLVDDGASLGGRERSTALRGKGRCLQVQSRSEDRDLLARSKAYSRDVALSTRIHVHVPIYTSIERSAQGHYSWSRSEGE